jgi:hypothetical protein
MAIRRYRWAVAVVLLAASHARAQQLVQAGDSSVARATAAGARDTEETMAHTPTGVRLGEAMLLHLGIGVGIAYDSNVFYEPTAPHQAGQLWIQPAFLLTNRERTSARAIDFSFRGGLNYVEYLTGDSDISNHRQFGVDAGLLAAFFPQARYNFQVFDNYIRSTQPPYTITSFNFDRDTNELGVRVNLAPGGGRLGILVGYRFGIDFFERSPLTSFNLFSHTFDLSASWKFLPKTAVYIAASETLNYYQNHGPPFDHPNSYPLHITAGIRGLITTKLMLSAWAGYANGFYQCTNCTNPNTGVGGLTLTWRPLYSSTGVLGYQHDFQNSLLGAYYDLDQAFISWTQMLWRFTLYARLWYANNRYQNIPATEFVMVGGMASSTRTDNYVTLNTRVDFNIKTWLATSIGYDLQFDGTDAQLGSPPSPPPNPPNPLAGIVPLGYLKHVVYLKLGIYY